MDSWQSGTNAAFDFAHGSNYTNIYSVNQLNQYLTAAGATITHDARGNLTSDGAKTYAYDADNRLTSVSGGASASLSYDPAGRLYQIAASATTRFLYDGAQAIAEYDGSNNLLRRYVPGPGIDETIVWYEGGANLNDKRWLLTDSRGSVVALTDDDGDSDLDDAGPNGPAINAYDEFGAPAAGNTGRFQFTGQMWLAEVGLYYYKARLYHSGLGRFLQTDPIGHADGLNMYAYVGNDPMNRADPSGLCATGSRLGSGWCGGFLDSGGGRIFALRFPVNARDSLGMAVEEVVTSPQPVTDRLHWPIGTCGATCWVYQRFGRWDDFNQAALSFAFRDSQRGIGGGRGDFGAQGSWTRKSGRGLSNGIGGTARPMSGSGSCPDADRAPGEDMRARPSLQ